MGDAQETEERLQKALDDFTAAIVAGRAPDIDGYCREHADCGPDLRERLEEIAYVVTGDGTEAWSHPESIGPYRILEVLGEGGMGTVYLAEQREPVRRRVALKVVKLGMDSRAVLRRFELERQALAVMDHENIARVFDCGATDRGQPYFALEYVPGVPLTDYCDEHGLSIEARVRLFRQLCDGVQHAHQKGVIHRDLKPGNVLVSEKQGRPVPKIIDFGLARATNDALYQATLHTDPGRVVGTPEYMSPEQADPAASDIDTRTDIYSLGVMLYELLVGTLPFRQSGSQRPGLLEMQRRVREEEPPRPSSKLSAPGQTAVQTAARRGTTPAALQRALRTDLDWVVLRAMDKDRNRRYQSVTELSLDLGRYLSHDPLEAGPPSASYRMRKLLRRYRAQVVAGGLVLVTAVAGAGVAIAYAAEAGRQRQTAEQTSEQLAAKVAEFDMLALVVHLREAVAAERGLHPSWPSRSAAMRAWLDRDAARLREALPEVRSTLAALRRREDRSESDRFLEGALEDVHHEIEVFEQEQVPRVAQRLRWSEQVEEATLVRHAQRWGEAREAIAAADGVVASERYAESPIDLVPQLGLVPIGMNPVTGLWEFYHLRSAWDPWSDVAAGDLPIPQHAADGRVPVDGSTGVVFVLIPGGAFAMGAQRGGASLRGHDPRANQDESPVRDVVLAPFFLARHELTRAQWRRLSTRDLVSQLAAGAIFDGDPHPIGECHPVEMVAWEGARDLLRQHRLALPTEAQWEYGARAGTTSPWWSGDEPDSLRGCGNVLDRSAEGAHPDWGTPEGGFEDGYVRLAPVDAFRSNPWGLINVYGNVWEWCRDSYGSYATPLRPGDGLREPPGLVLRVARGGSYLVPATYARSSYRHRFAPTFCNDRLGIRACRTLDR